ncbi:MAG TPA: succinate dehydrogenase cytochrome b subunit [Puia sp.]|jgi:succinate dehydrogenase / fumarate reductase cytochrome b subunit|nr:succinate dehydrogenase cytochrome b subunit [Puia sp.]
MKWSEFFTSSIGKKFIMSLTGIFLISFLVVHVGINACIWANDGGQMFNLASHFMATTIVIRIVEVGLFVGLLLHIIQGLVVEIQNRSHRRIGYAVAMGNKGSKWYSRSMGLLGTLLLFFLVMHLSHFWVPSRFTELPTIEINGKEVANQYAEIIRVFQNPLVVVLYVLGCISLMYHLLHGFQSAFRTLGVPNGKYINLIRGFGFGFSIIVSLAFAMMPVSVFIGWVS